MALGLPAAYVQGYGNPSRPYGYSDLSLFAQDDWRVTPNLTLKLGVRYQNAVLAGHAVHDARGVEPYTVPGRQQQLRAAGRARVGSAGRSEDVDPRGVRHLLRQPITGVAGIADIDQWRRDGVRTLVARFPADDRGVERARHQAAGAGRRVSEPRDLDRSRTGDAVRAPASVGVDRELPGQIGCRPTTSTCAASTSSARSTTTRSCRRSAPAGGPTTSTASPGTSASVLQYTSFGETWYRGLTVSATQALQRPLSVPRELHAVEGRGQLHRLPERVHPAEQRPRPRPAIRPGCRSASIPTRARAVRCTISGIVSCSAGSTSRPSTSALVDRDCGLGPAVQHPGRRRSQRRRRRRHLPRPDRARTNPARSADERRTQQRDDADASDRRCAREQAVHIGGRRSLEAIVEVFNLFNRTNFTEINNVFGTGVPIRQPLPAYGQFVQAAQPRQAQVAVKVSF